MAVSVASFSCYVRDCDEPMASITTPLIGPCIDHTDADVMETYAWMRERLSEIRAATADTA